MYCRYCGAEVREEHRFCANCGKEIAPTTLKSNKRVILIALAAAVLVALIALLVTATPPDTKNELSGKHETSEPSGSASATGSAGAAGSTGTADTASTTANASATANASTTASTTENAPATNAWAQFAKTYSFSSGAGAWSTDIEIADDGTFTGYYHDADMGVSDSSYPNGTRYETHFTGEFTTPEKVSDYEYAMQLKRLEITDEPGERIEDGVRIVPVTDEVYGLGPETDSPTGKYALHLPGQSVSALSDSAKMWLFMYDSDASAIDFYAIVNSSNSDGELAFRSTDM